MNDTNPLWFSEQCRPQLVPAIDDELLGRMLEQITPVLRVRVPGRMYHRFREILIEGVNRRDTAYIWEPALGRPVRVYGDGVNRREIITFHTWAHYGFFKPTLAEVMGCINQFVPDWSPIRYVWLRSQNMGPDHIIGDCHWCRCVLFGPEEFAVDDVEWSTDCGRLLDAIPVGTKGVGA